MAPTGPEKKHSGGQGMSSSAEMAITYGYILLWILLSAVAILLNKYILAYAPFPYPISLTLSHMAFCATLAFIIIKAGITDTVEINRETYIRGVLPVAALFAGTLWLGNAAYIYLSVAFIQMIKAAMPMMVFSVGVFLGTESYKLSYALNMALVGFGVAVASYGEINFNLVGVIFQVGSMMTESTRLCLIQILLQQRGVRLNPVTTLYYIAPACFAFLCIPFAVLELPKMMADPELVLKPGLLLGSAMVAFALNMSIFLLIGRSSALTMNVAGVLKDWVLIGVSSYLYKSPVTALQLGGYFVAFLGVMWYNHQKLQQMQSAPKPGDAPRDSESTPLMEGGGSGRK